MILIISAPRDAHAMAVQRHLERSGAACRILNLSEFPLLMDLTVSFETGKQLLTLSRHHEWQIDLADVSAVWWRRPQPFQPPEMTAPYRHFAMSESATAFQGTWQTMDALWINDPFKDAAASHKVWQLALASRCGLAVPETVITNDPNEARRFWAAHPGEVVFKAFSATYYAWRETRILRPDEQAMADSVRVCPVIFQKYVPAAADLRITAIGDDLFAAAATATDYEVDVRFNPSAKYVAHRLPSAVEEKLHSLMNRLGLEYGAIDMRLTPSGEYVFLEVNPAGQFLYIENATQLPISDALAKRLVEGASRRTAVRSGVSVSAAMGANSAK